MSPPVALALSLSLPPLPLVLLLLALSPACTGRMSGARASLHAHTQRVREFPCREPQPRAVNVQTLTLVRGDESYMPRVTVLHRCDAGSGCCGGADAECAPLEEEQVPLTFLIKYHVEAESERPATYVTVWASNHTRCECADASPK